MQVIVSGYIELAEKVIDKGKETKNIPLTRMLKDIRRSGLTHVAITTATINIEAAAGETDTHTQIPKATLYTVTHQTVCVHSVSAALHSAEVTYMLCTAPDYSHVPKIQQFKSNFDLAASGINVPKIVE